MAAFITNILNLAIKPSMFIWFGVEATVSCNNGQLVAFVKKV